MSKVNYAGRVPIDGIGGSGAIIFFGRRYLMGLLEIETTLEASMQCETLDNDSWFVVLSEVSGAVCPSSFFCISWCSRSEI